MSDALVTMPVTHHSEATVGEMRKLFLDEHVHMALLLDNRTLVAAVERRDLDATLADDAPARSVGSLRRRTVHADVLLSQVLESMRRRRQRRLAVTNEQGELLGLLCLKATRLGFCSDTDVASRKRGSDRH